MIWLIALLLLSNCAGHMPADVVPAAAVSSSSSAAVVPSPPGTPPTVVAKPAPIVPTAEQKEKAAAFDRFLNHDLSDAEENAMIDACNKNPASSLFCFGIIGSDALDQKYRASLSTGASHHTRRVKVKFAKGKIANWAEIRAASVNGILKSVSRLPSPKVRQLAVMSLAETACPNPAAVAAAATLEDLLPAKADLAEIAALYEKGGACLTDPDDKESVQTRAGLLYYQKKDLNKAAQALQKSTEIAGSKSPRPFYWLYRTRLELGDKSGAQSALDKLKERFPFAFHTIMARLNEGEDPDDILSRSTITALPKSKKTPEANAMVEASAILRGSGYNHSASKVLDWAIGSAQDSEPEFKLFLAQLKAEQQELQSIVFLLSRVLLDNPTFVNRETLSMYYPRAFFSIFEKNANGLDPYLLLAVARQESAFNPRAVSSARAKGLLQVKAGRRLRRANLLDPEVNIQAGSKFVNELLKLSGGRLNLALASYNAGPKRTETWLKRYPTSDPILFTDLIPFRETRNYVSLILRNYYWYHRIHNPIDAKIPWAAMSPKDQGLWPTAKATPPPKGS